MCGRFALYSSLAEIKKLFSIDTPAGDLAASYNIAPAHDVFAIISHEGRRLGMLHWGLVPFWAKDISGASKLINARVAVLCNMSIIPHKRDVLPFDKLRANGFITMII